MQNKDEMNEMSMISFVTTFIPFNIMKTMKVIRKNENMQTCHFGIL